MRSLMDYFTPESSPCIVLADEICCFLTRLVMNIAINYVFDIFLSMSMSYFVVLLFLLLLADLVLDLALPFPKRYLKFLSPVQSAHRFLTLSIQS